MTKKNLFKKIASVAMAGALTLSMALPVSAANNDPYLVIEENTKYSTQIKAGEEVKLGLMPAALGSNWAYVRTGFDSETDAKNGLEVQSISFGSDKISTDFGYGYMTTADGKYAGTVTVKGKDGAYGPASLHVVNKYNTSASIDMTVYVEAAENQSAVTVDSVDAVDLRDPADDANDPTGKTYEYAEDLSVAAADSTPENPFKESEGAAQSYPTAADALYSLAEENGISFVQSDGYVQSITNSNGDILEWYIANGGDYYGWNYCVIRDGEKVSEGDILSAAVLEVEEGDSVHWAFGTSDMATEYFDALVG